MKHNLKYTLQKLSQEVNRRYNNNRLLRYNTGKKVHQKQLDFHKCNKKNRWVFGGNRTGKTECGAVETIWMLRGIHPFKQNKKDVCGWAVSLSTQVQRDVAQSKILSYLNPDWIQEIVMLSGKKDSPSSGIIDKIYIKNVFGGISTLGFKSCDQGREKFQGTSLDFVWFDEEPPYDILTMNKSKDSANLGDEDLSDKDINTFEGEKTKEQYNTDDKTNTDNKTKSENDKTEN